MKKSIDIMIDNIKDILKDNIEAIYIYGSYTLDDFKLGWSDIDLLVLTKTPIPDYLLNSLLHLRQTLLEKDSTNMYYRSFEGAMLSLNSFINNTKENIIYWGTKGEKIKDNYNLDSFSMKELIEHGFLVYGNDIRVKLSMPTFDQLVIDIKHHYNTIREHAQLTGRNFYSFGWFLDISRCLYTLQTGNIIAKTKAGEWAIKNELCPNADIMKRILEIRNNPLRYKNEETFDYAQTLGPDVQKYADVLEKELNKL